jgi:hypothetical protein
MDGMGRLAPVRRRWLLAAADGMALVAFVLAGLARHVEGFAFHLVARNLGPLLVAWFAVGGFLRLYRRPAASSLLLTWLGAVGAAAVARSLWLGHPTGSALLTFLLVSWASTLVALLAFRGLAWLADRALEDGGEVRAA